MALVVVEQTNSRTLSNQGGSITGSRRFVVWDDSSAITQPSMISLGTSGLPAFGDRFPGEDLYASTWSFEPIPDSNGAWTVIWTYTPGDDVVVTGPPDRPVITPSEVGWSQRSFDFAGQFKDAWRSDPSLVVWNDSYNGTTDIGGRPIDAGGSPLSVFVPQMRIVITETVSSGSLSTRYQSIRDCVGKRNDASFKGEAKGTVLYEGASARRTGLRAYSLEHRFLVDDWLHAVQQPKLNSQGNVDKHSPNGYPQAKTVRWVQPFPETTNFYRISENF